MKFIPVLLVAQVFCAFNVQAAVLIEEGSQSAPSSSIADEYTPNPNRTVVRAPEPNSYLTGLSLREHRPISVGTTVGGPQGLFGIQGEYNLNPDFSLLTALGGGEGFRSVTFQVKQVFEGTYLLPYVAGGYTRWFSSERGPVSETTPNFLRNAFLSERGKETGDFAENIIFPSAGLQYVQLHGPYAGLSVFAEVTALIDLNRLVAAPTGGIGALYYF